MKIVDPGHVYLLEGLDNAAPQLLAFVKRDNPPEKFPGNIGHHAGVQVQEVLRVLVDRLEYVNKQIPSDHTTEAISDLKVAYWRLEQRAAERHNRRLDATPSQVFAMSTCNQCGHVQCEER